MFEVCYVKNQHQGHKFFSIKIKLLSNTKPSDNTKTIFIYIQFAFLEHTQSTHFEKPQQQLLLTNIRSVERVRVCACVCNPIHKRQCQQTVFDHRRSISGRATNLSSSPNPVRLNGPLNRPFNKHSFTFERDQTTGK